MNACQWTALACILTVSGYPIPLTAQHQQSSASLSAEALNRPLWLSVRAPQARLDGSITLNGRYLATLDDGDLQMNLSPYLSPGNHRLVVRGTVHPLNSDVTLELEGVGLQMSQQSSGSDRFAREIILKIR
ncbi:MAG: hypothetical protein AAFY11_01180 [Cyanobacteria bacterium J06641_5]